MGTLRTLLRLSSREVIRLLSIAFLLYRLDLRWRCSSLQALERAIEARARRARAAIPARPAIEEMTALARSVRLADDHGLLRPSCLRKALALAWLLGGRGVSATVEMGVAKTQGQLHAHAWLLVEGSPPLRFFDDPSFTPLEPRVLPVEAPSRCRGSQTFVATQ